MKIAEVRIRGLRGVRDLTVDLRGPTGAPRPVTLLVGPSGSGKTTFLDAISLAMGPATGFTVRRSDLRIHSRDLVHRAEARAEVEVTVELDADELERARTFVARGDALEGRGVVRWAWPDPEGRHALGRVDASNGLWNALQGKVRAVRAMTRGEGGAAELARALGRVTLVDQRRRVFGARISEAVAAQIGATVGEDGRVWDPREQALDLGIRARANGPGASNARAQYERLQELFARVCAPRRLCEPVVLEDESWDLEFEDGDQRYGWGGLSGGERAVFPLLLQAQRDSLNHGVLMVDEVELHLHPAWQRRLLQALPELGIDNQLILTTHSEYLRGAVRRDAVIDFGALTEPDVGEGA